MNKTSDNMSIALSILSATAAGLIIIAAVLGATTILQSTQATTTYSIASNLSKVNFNNFRDRKIHPNAAVSISNSVDIAKLLRNGLPKGYVITPVEIPRGKSVVCILTGPHNTKAIFTASGVSPYYSAEKNTHSIGL